MLENMYSAPYPTVQDNDRNAPHRIVLKKLKTTLHRTARFPKKKARTEPHRVISKIEKTHRGAVLHREKSCVRTSART